MGGPPKIGGFSPQIMNLNWGFHYFHHPFWGTTIFGNTNIYIYILYVSVVKPTIYFVIDGRRTGQTAQGPF